MNADEFVLAIEDGWGKNLTDKQSRRYVGYLTRFDGGQLERILEQLEQDCKYVPKIGHIHDAATTLGFNSTQPRTTPLHEWEETNCRLCHGEGRIEVIFEWMYDETLHPIRKLRRIFQYSGSERLDYRPVKGEYSYIFRCACLAGEAPGLSRKWPRWHGSNELAPVTKQVERADEDDLRTVRQIAARARRQPPRRLPYQEDDEIPF